IEDRIKPELQTKKLIDFIFDTKTFKKELVAAINPVTQATIETTVDQLKKNIGKKDDPWKMPPPKVKKIIHERDKPVISCRQTMRNQLNTTLESGYQTDESTDKLMDHVHNVFNNLSKYETRQIAATETSAVFGKSTHE